MKENGSARAIPALLDHAADRAEEREEALGALESLLPRGSSVQQVEAAEKLLAVARESDDSQSKRTSPPGRSVFIAEEPTGAAGFLIRAGPSLPAVFPVLLKGVRSKDPILLGICARALCDAWPASRPQVVEALRDASPESTLAFFEGVRRFTKQTSSWMEYPWTEPLADGPRSVAVHLAREHPHPDVRAVGLALALSTGLSQGGDFSRDTYDTELLAECAAPSAPPALRRAAVRLAAYIGHRSYSPDLGGLFLAEPSGSPQLVDFIQARDHRSRTSFGTYGVDLLDGVRCDWIFSRGPRNPDAWTEVEIARLEDILRTETDSHLRDAASAALAGRYLPRWNGSSTDAPPAHTFEVHEWGVWNDGGDFLSVAEATLSELPSFVHRTSASAAEVVKERSYSPSIVAKPVLFFHATEPFCVVVRVRFFEGRPWTYFPDATDELETTRPANRGQQPLVVAGVSTNFADRPGISPPWQLSKVPSRFFETAPWLIPPHLPFADRTNTGPIELAGMGVEWRGLRVGYDAALEPVPPAVDASSWWNFLREVQASPVAVHGEREEFLFYDGSTNVPAPVVPSWSDSTRKLLLLSVRSWRYYPTAEWLPWGEGPERNLSTLGLIPYVFVIRKDSGAAPRGSVRRGLSFEAEPEVVDVDALDLEGDRLSDAFGEALQAEGLSPEEAQSLLRTWESDFFQKPGLRLVTFLPRRLYDVAVPLSIYPAPSRVVRVALVLREVDPLP